ncbi:branched-chain amino acid ABC transporter permease [Ruminococcaceae bacterium OttesenSCG-928-A16]|nr:branched-chain amino acid ABC transporter permease [Ruminococcaceae bacterium OttesenSCG-928-A16]
MTMFMQVFVSGLVIGCVYGLIALGYSLIYKASGMMSFVQGDLLTVGAFLGYTFYGLWKIPVAISFVMVFILMVLLGFGIERGIINRLVKKKTLPIYIVLATIAVSYILQNGAMYIWGSNMLTFPRLFSANSIKIFGVGVQPEALFCIVVSLIAMVILHIFMKYTKYGTAMRAASMDPMAARSCGINVSVSTGLTWGIAAAMASLAGMLIGPVYGVFTTLGATIGRKGFSSAVMGGYGNMYGAIVGGIILGLMETFTSGYISSAYKDLFAYIILLLFLFVKPTGIFNERAIME